jgi:hypothetical protein
LIFNKDNRHAAVISQIPQHLQNLLMAQSPFTFLLPTPNKWALVGGITISYGA